MKTESTKAENNKPEASKPDAKARSGSAIASERGVTRVEVAVGDLVADSENRAIDESDEDFTTLVDSVRVMGVLVALQAQRRPDGKLQLIDGERRWRAARKLGIATVACDVWPEHAHPRDVTLAGVVMNEQRQAHSCLDVARRLRAVKNQFAETQEQVATRTGLPVARVKGYLNLFNASDRLLTFLEEEKISLRTAVELVRYEKTFGEVALRRLLERHGDEPLTERSVEALRKRSETRHRREGVNSTSRTAPSWSTKLVASIEAGLQKDPSSVRKVLEEMATKLGLRLIDAQSSAGS